MSIAKMIHPSAIFTPRSNPSRGSSPVREFSFWFFDFALRACFHDVLVPYFDLEVKRIDGKRLVYLVFVLVLLWKII